MDYPTNISGAAPAPAAPTIETLLNNLRSVREGIGEQRYRQERALSRLGFRPLNGLQSSAQVGDGPAPSTDAISVLAREIDSLSYSLNELGSYSDALERQYSEKAGQ